MRVIGFAGWSGSGKTTLLVQLIPALTRRGLRVSTIKHAHHAFDIDQPGKDSFRHREAGATEVLVGSSTRWALMHELRAAAEPGLTDLLHRMSPVDLVLVEGFKRGAHNKIEVFREAVGKPPLHPDDPSIVALAADPLRECAIPVVSLNDVEAVAALVMQYAREWDGTLPESDAGVARSSLVANERRQ